MKYFIPLLAVVMLLKPLWPVVEYVVNYDYIIENLCENRDKPMLNCDGKCFLAKQLAKEMDKKEKNPFGAKLSDLKLPIINHDSSFAFKLFTFESGAHSYSFGIDMISYVSTSKMLRPPELA